MDTDPHHLLITAGTAWSRQQVLSAERPDIAVDAHWRRVGPYAVARHLLEGVVPAAYERWPEIVERHKYPIVYSAPGLESAIGPAPMTLVDVTPSVERTRFFGHEYIRAVSHGIVDFLAEYTARRRAAGQPALTVGIRDLDHADPTDQTFVALALRRLDPAGFRIVITAELAHGSGGRPVAEDLDDALRRYSVRLGAPAEADRRERSQLARAEAYVASECTSDDPDEVAAYETLDAEARRGLHDARAAQLRVAETVSAAVGAIPFHLERGHDPGGVGRRYLREGLEYCVAKGFSAAAVDFGQRGAKVCDPVRDLVDFCHFCSKAASALVPLGRLEEAEALYRTLLRTSTDPKAHMTALYGVAMLHTRFFEPRDHDRAMELLNTARAIGSLFADPVERATVEVYQDNGRALVEMHRHRLEDSLRLVSDGLARLAAEVPEDRYVVHRTQLLHNRARVLVAMGRLDEARADFDRLVAADPYYVEYRVDRGNLAWRQADFDSALADYDRAVAYQPPFAEVHVNRGWLRWDAGDADGAEDDLVRAVELEPTLRAAWVALASVRLARGDAGGARAAADGGLKVTGGDAELLGLRAQAEELDGRLDLAAESVDASLAADPGHVPGYALRAALRYQADDFDGAVSDLTRALELGGDRPELRVNRGLAYEARGDLRLAQADMNRALECSGPDGRGEVEAHLARSAAKLAGGRAAATSTR